MTIEEETNEANKVESSIMKSPMKVDRDAEIIGDDDQGRAVEKADLGNKVEENIKIQNNQDEKMEKDVRNMDSRVIENHDRHEKRGEPIIPREEGNVINPKRGRSRSDSRDDKRGRQRRYSSDSSRSDSEDSRYSRRGRSRDRRNGKRYGRSLSSSRDSRRDSRSTRSSRSYSSYSSYSSDYSSDYSRSRSPVRHRGRTRSYSRSISPPRSRHASPRRGRQASYHREEPVISRKNVVKEDYPAKEPMDNGRKVLVNGLSKQVNVAHLKEMFEVYGELQNIELPVNRKLNTNKGLAYLTFANKEEASTAIEHMNNAQLDGSTLLCKLFESFQREKYPSSRVQQPGNSRERKYSTSVREPSIDRGRRYSDSRGRRPSIPRRRDYSRGYSRR